MFAKAWLATRLEKGDYASLSSSITQPWSELTLCRRKRLSTAADQSGDSQKVRRLDRTDLLEHFRKHGARGTYLASACDVVLQNGDKARVADVLPKYTSRHASEKPEEMRVMVKLSLASTKDEVLRALERPETQNVASEVHHSLYDRHGAMG